MLIKTFQLLSYYKEQLNRLNQVTINSVQAHMHEQHLKIINLSGMMLVRPKIIIANRAKDLSNLVANMKSFNRIYFANKRGYIGHYLSVVRLMSPQNILNKGFAIVRINGHIASDAAAITAGVELTIDMAAAEIKAQVLSKSPKNGREFEL